MFLLKGNGSEHGQNIQRQKQIFVPQLYYTQADHLITAKHHEEIFQEPYIKLRHMMGNMQKWENKNQTVLRKLLQLIGTIRKS